MEDDEVTLPNTLKLPNTRWHPIPLLDHGFLTDVEEIIIHINDGSTEGTLSWWAQTGHEPDGAHIQVSKDGTVYQTVLLNRVCWHCPPVNHTSIGVEHEGFSRAEHEHAHDSRPEVQLHASANRVAWLLHECGLGRPVHGRNVKPHSAHPEGGHPNCPGPWDWDL